jgi:hypothetical protein
MPSYALWNQALIDYFCQSVPQGSQIYLSVDEDVLYRVGQSFFPDTPVSHLIEDFQQGVINHVISSQEVNLKPIQGLNKLKKPNCVAFLSLSVLAAYKMANEEEISELNYFRRLREILQLPGTGRPLGMKSGGEAEGLLWTTWNRWLLEQGFIPSAKPSSGPKKYINYPISQCLLRQADKEKLQVLFSTKQWKTTWDASILFSHIRQEAAQNKLNSHLKELVLKTTLSTEAVKEAIHELHLQWLDLGCPLITKNGNNIPNTRIWSRNLLAGIYRTEDPFLGQIDYYLYPKQPRGRQLEKITIEYENQSRELIQERPGWYLPLGEPLEIQSLSNGLKCPITNHPELEQLHLSARDFWLLIPDPENPESGIFASWGNPPLGTPFILLFQPHLLKDLERLRDEQLIKWTGEPQYIDETKNWLEIHQCLVISQAWDSVFIEHQELKDALIPTSKLSISLSGGLRIPQEKGWLKGYAPNLTIFGFCLKANLEVINLANNQIVLEKTLPTNKSQPLDLPTVGNYLLRATLSKEQESTERYLRILHWESLETLPTNGQEFTKVTENYSISGAIIHNNQELNYV